MSASSSNVSVPHVANRLRQLVYSSPAETALFFADVWTKLYNDPLEAPAHEAMHALALVFLATNQPYSALHLVRPNSETYYKDIRTARPKLVYACGSCAYIYSRCCEKVGRYSEGQAILLKALRMNRTPSKSLGTVMPD